MKKIAPTSNLAFCIAILTTLVVFNSDSHAAKLYKWVDKDGNISYQDQAPPENVKILKEDILATPTASSGRAAVGETRPIIVYTIADCVACDNLIERFTEMGVPTDNRLLDQDPDAQRRILEQSGGVAVPTVLIGDQLVTEIDLGKLSAQLKEAGYVLKEDPNAPETTPETSEPEGE